MARGRKALDYGQQQKLKAVAEADDAWRHAKKYAEAEARKVAEEKIAQFSAARDRAIYDAVQAGVPKVLIGSDALNNSSPYAVLDAVRRVEEAIETGGITLAEVVHERFAWGEILAASEDWVYGWIVDTASPTLSSTFDSGDGPLTYNGYFVSVDRKNSGTTITTGSTYYTNSDGGFEELREWAVQHAGEVEFR